MKDYNYSRLAKYYDILELDGEIEKLNGVLDKLLKKFNVKKVLDISCGTGAQSIYLAKKGYVVAASDISNEMLEIAKEKARGLGIKFSKGDMKKIKAGKFDAVISIFNAIGHLSKNDFEDAVQNVGRNLNGKGIFIFDIFNLDFMKLKFRTDEFIDKAIDNGKEKFVRFNKNTFDKNRGIMHVNQRTFVQGNNELQNIKESWDLQIYSSGELKKILERNGFEIIEFLSMDGAEFNKEDSPFILTIARKREE